MTVTSPSHIRVIVDGVEWQPVSSASGTDTYALTVGGRVLMFDNDGIVFSFLNEVTPDFTFYRNYMVFVRPSGNTTVNGGSMYIQTVFPDDVTQITLTVYPDNMEDLESLTITLSQDEATATFTRETNNVFSRITGFDPTQPLAAFIGNVLIAYILPQS